MLPAEGFLGDVGRALANAADELRGSSSIVADSDALLSMFIKGELRRMASQDRLAVPVPRFCIFSVTWRCNLTCIGCYAKGYRPGTDMPPLTIQRVMQDAIELGTFLFVIGGGEPLLVDGLIEMLGELEGALFMLFTNGTVMQPRHVSAIAKARNVLPVISVEGEKNLTDHRRGGGVGEKVAMAMDMLKGEKIPFGFASMVTHRNLPTVTSREWFDNVWAAGASLGFLIDYIPFPGDLDPALVLTPQDMALKEDLVKQRYRQARPLVVNLPPDECDAGHCQAAGQGFLHINADGYVEPCPFSHFAADNVMEKPLSEILGSKFFRSLRKEMRDLSPPSGHCLLFSNAEKVKAIAARTGAFNTETG